MFSSPQRSPTAYVCTPLSSLLMSYSILFGISLTVAGCYALLPAYAGGADHQWCQFMHRLVHMVQAGGGSNLAAAVRYAWRLGGADVIQSYHWSMWCLVSCALPALALDEAFKFKKAEAILVITDGKTEVGERYLSGFRCVDCCEPALRGIIGWHQGKLLRMLSMIITVMNGNI